MGFPSLLDPIEKRNALKDTGEFDFFSMDIKEAFCLRFQIVRADHPETGSQQQSILQAYIHAITSLTSICWWKSSDLTTQFAKDNTIFRCLCQAIRPNGIAEGCSVTRPGMRKKERHSTFDPGCFQNSADNERLPDRLADSVVPIRDVWMMNRILTEDETTVSACRGVLPRLLGIIRTMTKR